MFQVMLNDHGDSLSDLASSDNEVNTEDDDDEDTALGTPGNDDELSWVVGTICRTLQQRMERFRQRQIVIDELTQPELGDAADHFQHRDEKYVTTELRVPAVVRPQTEDIAPAPAHETFGELTETLGNFCRISQQP